MEPPHSGERHKLPGRIYPGEYAKILFHNFCVSYEPGKTNREFSLALIIMSRGLPIYCVKCKVKV